MKITVMATAAVAGAFLALPGVGAAHAGTTTGDGATLNGNQVSVPIALPVDDCGNIFALLAVADAGCAGAARAAGVSWDGGFASGSPRAAGVSWDGGFASGSARAAGVSWDGGFSLTAVDIGSQIGVPVAVPAGGCGKSVAADRSSCRGGAVNREHGGIGLLAPAQCSCVLMPCPCVPVPCPCGVSDGSRDGRHASRDGHHASPNGQRIPPNGQHLPLYGEQVAPHQPMGHPSERTVITTPRAPAASAPNGAPMPIIGMLPVTGVNLAGITGSALGLLGTGTGALFGAARVTTRRRRRGPA